jgi:hypothetical protein
MIRMIIPIIQLTIFVLYILYIYNKFGVLSSISESWYKLQDIKKSYLFTLFCMLIGCLMFFNGTGNSVFYFLSGVGLCFSGTAAAFRSKGAYTNIVHFTGAGFAVLFGAMGLWYEFGNYIPLLIIFLSGLFMLLTKFSNFLWWFEITSFLAIVSGVLLSSL